MKTKLFFCALIALHAMPVVAQDRFAGAISLGKKAPAKDAQRGLQQINALEAYKAHGVSGKGQTIAVLDSGLDPRHPRFEGRIESGYDYIKARETLSDPNGHGTHVAGIIAAEKINKPGHMHGVAYDAKIIPFRILGGSGKQKAKMDFGGALNDAFDRAHQVGARVVNASWGIPKFTILDADKHEIDAGIGSQIDAYRKAVDREMVIVRAAGNDGFTEVSIDAGLPLYYPELKPHWIAVVAVSGSNHETMYTNRCGEAKDWCIAAPGGGDFPWKGVLSTRPGGGFQRMSGTSMAAPFVSGALALVMEHFPELTSAQVVQRIFKTADKTKAKGTFGGPGTSEQFGHGMLDVYAALSPVKETVIPTSTKRRHTDFLLKDTKISLSPAFGDGLKIGLSGKKIGVFDPFDGARFLVPLDDFVVSRPSKGGVSEFVHTTTSQPRYRHAALNARARVSFVPSYETLKTGGSRMHFNRVYYDAQENHQHVQIAFQKRWKQSFIDAGPNGTNEKLGLRSGSPYLNAMKTGWQSQIDDDRILNSSLSYGLGYGYEEGTGNQLFHALLSWKNQPDHPKRGLQLGVMDEKGTLLGAKGRGAMGTHRHTVTLFSGIQWEQPLVSGWRIDARYDTALSQPKKAPDGIISAFSHLASQSYTLKLSTSNEKGNAFGLMLHQPLRVYHGHMTLRVPIERDRDENIMYEPIRASLVPSGQEQDLAVFLDGRFLKRFTFHTEATRRTQPNHVRAARPILLIGQRFRWEF